MKKLAACAYFANFFSFYLTYCGLQNFHRWIFGPIFFSKIKCTNFVKVSIKRKKDGGVLHPTQVAIPQILFKKKVMASKKKRFLTFWLVFKIF